MILTYHINMLHHSGEPDDAAAGTTRIPQQIFVFGMIPAHRGGAAEEWREWYD
jgi:hypothetical protein